MIPVRGFETKRVAVFGLSSNFYLAICDRLGSGEFVLEYGPEPEVPPVTALIIMTRSRSSASSRVRRLSGTRSPSTGPCASSAGQ